jgi:hypothetical protein
MATPPTEFLLQLPCKILFWEISSQEWRGSKKGTIFLVPYDNHEKTQVVFKPRGEEATTMWYVDDVASLTGGMRAKIHEALSVQRHDHDLRAIVFGKAASRSYINENGRAIKTAWVAKFDEFWQANAFAFMLNSLVDKNGRFSAFDEERNEDLLDNFFASEREDEYETEDNNANDNSNSDDDYGAGGGGGTGEGKQEEESDDDFDIETALRLRRQMAQPDGSSDYDDDEDDEEEVAESQSLFN